LKSICQQAIEKILLFGINSSLAITQGAPFRQEDASGPCPSQSLGDAAYQIERQGDDGGVFLAGHLDQGLQVAELQRDRL